MNITNNEEFKQRRKESIEKFKQEKMKNEAIKQMRLAHFKDEIIKEFEQNNTIFVSKLGNDLCKTTDKQMNLIKAYEEYKNIKIYHLEQRQTERREFLHYYFINSKSQNKIMTNIRNL